MFDLFKSHYRNFSKFAIVGILNTIIDFTVFYVLFELFDFYYVFAHICAFLVAVTNSFIFNALWTFKNLKREQIKKQVSIFVLIACFGLVSSTVIIQMAQYFVNVYIAKVIAILCIMFLNYIGSWLLVFKD